MLWTGCWNADFCGITMIYLRAAWLLGMHTQGFIRVALKLRRLIFKRWDLCGFFRKCLRRPDAGKSSHCDNRARPKSTLSSWIYSGWNCILLSGSRVSVHSTVQRDQALKVSARRIRRKNRANKTSLQVKCSKTIWRSVSGLGTPLLPNFDDFLENFQKIMLQILPL